MATQPPGGYNNPAFQPPPVPVPHPPVVGSAASAYRSIPPAAQPPQMPYVSPGQFNQFTAPGGFASQLNATFPGGAGQPGNNLPTPPNYGGGGGPAAPATDPNWHGAPPNPGDWWLPDGEGPSAHNPAGGHWVGREPSPPAGTGVLPPGTGVGAGAGNFNPMFYAPTTNSPYLTLPQNWLGYVDPTTRQQLQQQLEKMKFNPTGDVGQFGEQMYLRPSQFNIQDLNQISDPAIRQWLRFFLGNLGYGISYQLPNTPTAPGIPQAPPNPNATAA